MDFVIDLEALQAEFAGMEREVETVVKEAAHLLAVQTHAHVMEQAAQKLRSRLKMFREGQKTDGLR